MLRILSRCNARQCGSFFAAISPPDAAARSSSRNPWDVQKRFMGGAKKSMARARKNFAKKQKKEVRTRQLAKREVVPALDKELRKDTKMRMVWNVKLILASRNGRVIPSIEFARLSRDLGFPRPCLFPKFIQQFPGIFRISADKQERSVRWLEFSDKADSLMDEEERVMREVHEPLIVLHLRKLLMMAPSRRLLLNKIAHIRPSFWIPDDFRSSILPKYPEFFSVTGGYLELMNYDPALAVSTREKNRLQINDVGYRPHRWNRDRTGESNRYAFKITFERHKVLESNIAARLLAFQQLPFPGPYDPIDDLDPRSVQAQKRAVGVCHEFLSFTVEKRAYVDHIAFFRQELHLPDKLEDMLARYPHIFYVCMRGERHVVFLKEFYRHGQLVEKHPLITIRQRFSKLMEFTTLARKPVHPLEFKGICAEDFVPSRDHQSFPPTEVAAAEAPTAGNLFHAQQHNLQVRQSQAQQAPTAGNLFHAQQHNLQVRQSQAQQAPTPGNLFHSQQHNLQVRQSPGNQAQQAPTPGNLFQVRQPPGSDQQHIRQAPGNVFQNALQVHQPVREEIAVPHQGGLFLQLGFSDDEDSKEIAAPVQKQQSLARKLGIASDDEDSEDERRSVSADNDDPWGSWKNYKDEPEEKFGSRKKKHVKKPFWEKRPFDSFDDPFF